MKVLIDQERCVYNEERERMECDIDKMARLAEAKVRLIRNRLLGLLQPGEFQEDGRREVGVEEIIDRV